MAPASLKWPRGETTKSGGRDLWTGPQSGSYNPINLQFGLYLAGDIPVDYCQAFCCLIWPMHIFLFVQNTFLELPHSLN